MDTIAHGLVGLNIANLGFRERMSKKASYGVAALAANAPDIDILLLLKGRADYTYWHRGITHSAIGLLILPPLIALLARRFVRASFKDLYLLCLLAQLSHVLLDVFNFWGTMVGSPFHDHRYTVPWLFVFDVFMWLILLCPLLLEWRGDLAPRRAGLVSFGLLGAYYVLCGVNHGRALAATERAATLAGLARPTVHAYPRPLLPTLWNGVASTADTVVQVDIDVLDPELVQTVRVFPRRLEDPWVKRALATDVGKHYPWFAPEVIGSPPADARDKQASVALFDMRFYPPPWAKLREARNSLAFPLAKAVPELDALRAPSWGAPWPQPARVYRAEHGTWVGQEQAAR